MHRLIADRQEEISELCRRYGVRKLEVFGSAARGSDFGAESDADFVVEFGPRSHLDALEEFFGLREQLARMLGRKVDLVEAAALRNPYLMRQIEQDRELVYAA